jgi:hypothetical protein
MRTMSQEEITQDGIDEEAGIEGEEITLVTSLKLLLFLVWWFSSIGVGTAFMSPGIIGAGLSPELFVVIILANFGSMLLIITLVPGPDDDTPEGYANA